MVGWLALAVGLLLTMIGPGSADGAEGKISGLMFGDYYAVVKSDMEVDGQEVEGRNGFGLRRIYFTYDGGLNEAFAVRFRLEMNTLGDFRTQAKIEPFVKDAHIKWTRSGHAILFGLSPTPSVAVVQNFWGYRSLLKNPLILQKFGSTRDTGIAFKGTIDPLKRVSYHFMFGNGSGTKSDVGEEKKVYLSLVARPAGGLIIETYGDWETRDDAGRFTGQGFVGYGRERFRAGAHFARQTRRRQGPDGEDLNLEFLSLFGVGMLAEKV